MDWFPRYTCDPFLVALTLSRFDVLVAQKLFLLCISHKSKLDTSTPHKLLSKNGKGHEKAFLNINGTPFISSLQKQSYTINSTYYTKLMDIIQINANTAPTYFATSIKLEATHL